MVIFAAGSTGTIASFGTQFTGFGAIVLDSGAQWELDGNSPPRWQSVTLAGTGDVLALGTPGGFLDAISGFAGTDTLDLKAWPTRPPRPRLCPARS